MLHLLAEALIRRLAEALGQIRLEGHEQPAGVEHQAEQHDAQQPVEQLPGIAGIEHITDGLLQGIARRAGEHLHPLGEALVGLRHGTQAESS